MTMGELLNKFPGAQRALFRSYHIGGCSSCGFSPDETLANLCERNGSLPVEEVANTILAGYESDRTMEISVSELAQRLNAGEKLPVIDVRSREEWDAVHMEQGTFFTQDLMQEIISHWPKDREFIFVCHHGIRSLDAASFFAGHGFYRVRSLAGGIDQWSAKIDSSLPRYHLE